MTDEGFGARIVSMANLSFNLMIHSLGIDKYPQTEAYFKDKYKTLLNEMSDWLDREDKEQTDE